jgi:hypothetical protein
LNQNQLTAAQHRLLEEKDYEMEAATESVGSGGLPEATAGSPTSPRSASSTSSHSQREGDGIEQQRRALRASRRRQPARWSTRASFSGHGQIEAKQFEGAIAANPDYAESHYQLNSS